MNILSMTGFGGSEGLVGEIRYRVEVKALNHRYLDIKVRLPRELSSAELPLRAAIQGRFSRGSIDLKVERLTDGAVAAPQIQMNTELARAYAAKLRELARDLKLKDELSVEEIARYPDVFSRPTTTDLAGDEAWKKLAPLVDLALHSLAEMRKTEGTHLAQILLGGIDELEKGWRTLKEKRTQVIGTYSAKIREKIKIVFDSYPLENGDIQSVLESRVAQELALLSDRTDIEEELDRFHGHLGHFRKVLKEGGPVGRKLDFILQEFNREINTLGNKAQDFQMSEEVVRMKVKLEQLREQALNVE